MTDEEKDTLEQRVAELEAERDAALKDVERLKEESANRQERALAYAGEVDVLEAQVERLKAPILVPGCIQSDAFWTASNTSAWPDIDPRIRAVGVSKLRQMNSNFLRKLGGQIYIIQENDKPLAVVVNYDEFLHLQKEARDEQH